MKLDKCLDGLKGKSFLSISDINYEQINSLLDLSIQIKNNNISFDYSPKILGLIFEKSSTRTRVSFEVACHRLNLKALEINPLTSQISRGEPIKDTARVLSKYVDALSIRTFDQSILAEYDKWGSVPIINALTDLEHPCQILADFLTIKEEFGDLDNIVISYFGDSNNVANSLLLCSSILGVQLNIGCPNKFKPSEKIIKKCLSLNKKLKIPKITNDPFEAAKGSHVIYTDVWSSMGQEAEALEKEKLFREFTVNRSLVEQAQDDHIILHCLPAYRGKEITDDVFESKSSRIFKQAENRLHVQQALLAAILS
tara:strand:+ start:1170 stop:2105 length:936 start_codon:yes stop_codon:yes gene_type:complete